VFEHMTEHIEYQNGKHVIGVGAPLFLAAVLENVCEDILRSSEIDKTGKIQ
jgi:hypothetical protein